MGLSYGTFSLGPKYTFVLYQNYWYDNNVLKGRQCGPSRRVDTGWHFTNTDEGVVSFKPAAPGVFLVQSGRFLVVQKFYLLEFGFTYSNLGATCLVLYIFFF